MSDLALRSKAHWGYSQDFIEACRTELSYGTSQIESPRWSFLVAEEADVIIGFYALEQVSEQEAELAPLFVCPEWIEKGIGRTPLSDSQVSSSTRRKLGADNSK